jgi:hypothetical protein
MSTDRSSHFANTPEPPYYIVSFSSIRTEGDNGYGAMGERMEALALVSGQRFDIAMTPLQTLMMLVTLLVAAINLNDGQTNAIEGMTHFVLFGAFLMLLGLGL